MMMRKLIFAGILMWGSVLMGSAQDDKQAFSPQKFEAELQSFIVKEAALSQEESTRFFPVYNEMRSKQRVLFERQRNMDRGAKPADENACKKAIQERDNIELEQKRIAQSYHNKFLDILPASKVYDVLRAEDKFHRTMLKQWGHRQKPKEKKKD